MLNWTIITTLVFLGCVTVQSAPLDGGKGRIPIEQIKEEDNSVGGESSKIKRYSEGFSLRRDEGERLHSEGPELEEAAAIAAGINDTSVIRGKRLSPDLTLFLKNMVKKRINCSVEFPFGDEIDTISRSGRATQNKDNSGQVVCSAGGLRFVLDGGSKELMRFLEETDRSGEESGVYLKKRCLENKNENGLIEDENETSAIDDEEGKISLEEEKSKQMGQQIMLKGNVKRYSNMVGPKGVIDDSGGQGGAGGGSGGSCGTTESATFRVYPPFFPTPCFKSTQSCPTKPCPVRPRPVMFITAPPPRVCPCPTICCLGEPTCACSQATTCPTLPSSTCHEHTCPLTGQAKVKHKIVASRQRLKAITQNQDDQPINEGPYTNLKDSKSVVKVKEDSKANQCNDVKIDEIAEITDNAEENEINSVNDVDSIKEGDKGKVEEIEQGPLTADVEDDYEEAKQAIVEGLRERRGEPSNENEEVKPKVEFENKASSAVFSNLEEKSRNSDTLNFIEPK